VSLDVVPPSHPRRENPLHRKRFKPTVLLVSAALLLTAACGGRGASTDAGTTKVASTSAAGQLRLGYFANVTHAGAVYGVGTGVFQQALGTTKLSTQIFNAGPAAVEALFAGAIDAAYVGPNPAINGFVKSKGEALRIVAGATSGGASLVVKPEITSPAQLKGKRIADPQTGGTQDIALRSWLAGQGFKEQLDGSGDVTILAQENAATLDLFKAGRIDGAWVPEPWASRLVLDGGGKVLADEKSLWPGGRFVTTNLIVSTAFLTEHPATVEALLRGQVEADRQINADKAKAQTVVNAELKKLTGKSLQPAVIARAFAQIEITEDPVASSLKTAADHAAAIGLTKGADVKGIYDLRLLGTVLGRTVDDAGLGRS
jgi:NitT/TauT family transport system substrate-binding protein